MYNNDIHIWRRNTNPVTDPLNEQFDIIGARPMRFVFADETSVAPTVGGEPTLAEIRTWVNSVNNGRAKDSVIPYNGTDTYNDDPTRVFLTDTNGDVIEIALSGSPITQWQSSTVDIDVEVGDRWNVAQGQTVNFPTAPVEGDRFELAIDDPANETWDTLSSDFVAAGATTIMDGQSNLMSGIDVLELQYDAVADNWKGYLGTGGASGGGSIDTTGFDSVREALFGHYGRGTPTSSTVAPINQQRSIPLANVVVGGNITYDAVNNGFVIPDGTIVEINGITNPQSASQRTINIINSTTSISNVPLLTQVNTSTGGSGINPVRIYQGIYENNTGGDVIIGMGVTGAGNTGTSSTTGYLMVRRIN